MRAALALLAAGMWVTAAVLFVQAGLEFRRTRIEMERLARRRNRPVA